MLCNLGVGDDRRPVSDPHVFGSVGPSRGAKLHRVRTISGSSASASASSSLQPRPMPSSARGGTRPPSTWAIALPTPVRRPTGPGCCSRATISRRRTSPRPDEAAGRWLPIVHWPICKSSTRIPLPREAGSTARPMWLSDDRQSGPPVPCAVGAVEEWLVQRRAERRARRADFEHALRATHCLTCLLRGLGGPREPIPPAPITARSSPLLCTMPPPPVDDSPNRRAARDKGHIAEVADMVSAASLDHRREWRHA